MLELFVIVIVMVTIGEYSFEVLHVSGCFGGLVLRSFGRSVDDGSLSLVDVRHNRNRNFTTGRI